MCKFAKLIQWPCKFTLTLLILHIYFFSLCIPGDKGIEKIEWIVVIVFKEKKQLKKLKKNWHFNEIVCRIDNLVCVWKVGV